MAKVQKVEEPLPVIPMLRSDFLSILVLGGLIGLLIWIVSVCMHRYVFDAYFCGGDIVRQCGSASTYSIVVGTLVGAVVALGGLIRLRVYRPLLVLIASILSTWGIVQLSWSFSWLTGILIVIALFALTFGLYSWIARVREFWLTLLLMVVLVVSVRLALMA